NSVSNFGTLREVAAVQAAQASGQPGNSIYSPDANSSVADGSSANDANVPNSLSAAASSAPIMTGITAVGSAVQVTFSGAPSSSYQILRAARIDNSTSWEVLGSVTADSLGQGTFTDGNTPAGKGYYRAKQSP